MLKHTAIRSPFLESETFMETWPPALTDGPSELDTNCLQAYKINRFGYIALGSSALAIVIDFVCFFVSHDSILGIILGIFSLPLTGVGLMLGLASRSTLAGRLALLGPLFLVGMFAYYMLCWYHILA